MGSSLSTSSSDERTGVQPFLRVKGLCKKYIRGGLWGRRVRINAAVKVDLDINAGQTLALLGKSGSGKSSVARCVTRLEQPDAGEILVHGTDIATLDQRELLPFRSRIQMVFQDPITSVNPRFSALEAIEEPLLIRGKTGGGSEDNHASRRDIVRSLMNEVGIPADWSQRRITQFSGGQGQRLALARALTLQPELLVLDEALWGWTCQRRRKSPICCWIFKRRTG